MILYEKICGVALAIKILLLSSMPSEHKWFGELFSDESRAGMQIHLNDDIKHSPVTIFQKTRSTES